VQMTTTRTRALDAAIELVGTEGLRALTHVRVDDRATLPRGSTSNYFRTRAALLAGVVERIIDRELPQVEAAEELPAAADDLVDVLCALLDATTGPGRTLTTARLVVFLEASNDPDLREALARGRVAMEAATVGMLARMGAKDPESGAAAIMACSEGVILHRIARHDETDPRAVIELVVRAALQ
ncbi:MAG: TetR family transcriptional regulator, partial [Mycetocola sp.]